MKKAYFYGNPVSKYGVEHGRVDYLCFAKAFDAVLNNNIIRAGWDLGEWEPINGGEWYEDSEGNEYTPDEALERVAELVAKRDALQDELEEFEQQLLDDSLSDAEAAQQEEIEKEIEEISEDIHSLYEVHEPDVYQWYIVSEHALPLLEEAGEIVYYHEELDVYLWGVTHFGTSWDYVLTSIPCNVYDE